MEEARRILRHVLPGVTYGVETVLLLFIVWPEWTSSKLTFLISGGSLGVAVGSFLVFDALGYFFSTVHHWWYWTTWHHGRSWTNWLNRQSPDHSEMIKGFIEKGLIPNVTMDGMDREKALAISLVLWYQGIKPDRSIGDAADKKHASLGDTMHGLGAARIASVFALLTVIATGLFCFWNGTFSFYWNWQEVPPFMAMFVIWLCVTLMFESGYRQAGKITKGFFEGILKQTVVNNQRGENAPTKA